MKAYKQVILSSCIVALMLIVVIGNNDYKAKLEQMPKFVYILYNQTSCEAGGYDWMIPNNGTAYCGYPIQTPNSMGNM